LIVDRRCERRYSVRIRWCCTHRLRESVTDAEQLMMVASKASINSYLKRAGKTIGDAPVDHLVGFRRRLLSEHGTREPLAEAFNAWLVIVRTARPTA
jgi:hypothetical protein